MCKSEYKLIRKMQWDGDVLKVQDTMHDVLREAKQAAEDAMTGEVLNHFECDFSDFMEYMHDKIKWERKQELAIPHWIPVTERLPEKGDTVLALFDRPDVKNIMYRVWVAHDVNVDSDIEVAWRNGEIVAWCPIPEPPKGDD